MMPTNAEIEGKKIFTYIELSVIIFLACVPLFLSFPYRVNIFLSWEGAYRLSQGQIPYKDFGMPVGYMFWVVPGIFFKIFGAQMITLIKAQVFINIVSGLAFRSILKSLQVQPGIRLLSVLLYCISFSFFNFWPWYNHTVIVYQMVGLAFLMRYFFSENKNWLLIFLSALFTFFSFFTKQDGGGLALLLCLALLLYYCFQQKNYKPLLLFAGTYLVVAFAIIAPLTRYNFGYWFNHGQAPHAARFSVMDVLNDFLFSSQWIKFYLFLILVLSIAWFKNWKQLLVDKKAAIFLLLTLGILAEAAILQVTSYTPPDNNIFYHSFAFAFILSFLSHLLQVNFSRTKILLAGCVGLCLWWSGVFWNYFQRILQRTMPVAQTPVATSTENIVNRNTYMLPQANPEIPMSEWKFSNLKSFKKIYMPAATVDGIERLMQMPQVKNNKELKILNMTELTPLAVEIPYQTETGMDVPLWHHLGVAMFNKDAVRYETKIAAKTYDLVLFEYIPVLNNFFPFRVRERLFAHYNLIDSFPAPRRGETQGLIEVFVPK